MSMLPRALAVAAVLWPVAMGAAVVDRVAHEDGVVSAIVYTAASRICHQRPDRSFHSSGHPWPVCGRCSGLYLAAPFGAWAGRRWWPRRVSARVGIVLAAVPTVATLILEFVSPDGVSSVARAVAALPLGFAVSALIVHAAGGGESIG